MGPQQQLTTWMREYFVLSWQTLQMTVDLVVGVPQVCTFRLQHQYKKRLFVSGRSPNWVSHCWITKVTFLEVLCHATVYDPSPNFPHQLLLSWLSVHCQFRSRRHRRYWLCKVSRQSFLRKYCSLPGHSLRRASNWELTLPSTASTQQNTSGVRHRWKGRRFNQISRFLCSGIRRRWQWGLFECKHIRTSWC